VLLGNLRGRPLGLDQISARPGFCQPSTLRIAIWPDANDAQNNMVAVSADGSTVSVVIAHSDDRDQLFRLIATRAARNSLKHSSEASQFSVMRPMTTVDVLANGNARLGADVDC
jgi:hypothetical protein